MSNVIQAQFVFNPFPNPPAAGQSLPDWKRDILQAHGDKLPAVLPEWWDVDRIIWFAGNGRHEAKHVATIERVSNVREKLIARRRDTKGRVAA